MPITLNLKENPFFQEAFAEGEERGRQQGREEGRVEGEHRFLSKLSCWSAALGLFQRRSCSVSRPPSLPSSSAGAFAC
jgi:hypothetical protein